MNIGEAGDAHFRHLEHHQCSESERTCCEDGKNNNIGRENITPPRRTFTQAA